MTGEMANQHAQIASAPLSSTPRPISGAPAQVPAIPHPAGEAARSSHPAGAAPVAPRESKKRVDLACASPQSYFVSRRYIPSDKCVYNRRIWQDIVREAGTQIIAKTGDVTALGQHQVEGTMLDPATAWENLFEDDFRKFHAQVAVHDALEDGSYTKNKHRHTVLRAAENYAVELGTAMMKDCKGPHFSFIDPRRGHKDQIISQAIRMTEKFKQKGVDTKRVVFSFPATLAGIDAATALHVKGIQTNLTYVTTALHALACIAAGAEAITFSLANCLKKAEQEQPGSLHRAQVCEGVIREIQATIAFVHASCIDTKIVVTDVSDWEFLEPLWGVDFIALGDERPFSWQPVSRRDNVQGDFVFYRASRTSETVSYALSFEALDADREKAVELQMRIWEDVVKAWRSSTLGWKKAREAMRAMVQALGQEVYKQSIGMWSPYEIDRHFYKGYSSVLEEKSLYRWSKDPIACLHGSLRFDIFGQVKPEYAEEVEKEAEMLAEYNRQHRDQIPWL